MKINVLKPDGSIAVEEYDDATAKKILAEAEKWEVELTATRYEVWAATGDEDEYTVNEYVKRIILNPIAVGDSFAGFMFMTLGGDACINGNVENRLLLSRFGGKGGDGYEDIIDVDARGDGGGSFFVDTDGVYKLVKGDKS